MTRLPDTLLAPLVHAALAEDLGDAGDLTTDAVVPADVRTRMALVARADGVVAGTDLARIAFAALGADLTVDRPDGAAVRDGDVIGVVEGPARAVLTAERVALNFLGHLSGVATATAEIAGAIAHTPTRVTCTRKTTPGLRAVEKAAVAAGGGVNHRFGLYDAVLVKDNHLAVAGSVTEAVRRARRRLGHLVKIEVEVEVIDQLQELLRDPVDVVLLDNMDPGTLRRAVELVDGRMTTEASGRVTAATAPVLAGTGVDLISVGWITHSAPVLDIGLDALP
jgi:nicotinate-nucleotide pyrophosphorylase (carboxylating)